MGRIVKYCVIFIFLCQDSLATPMEHNGKLWSHIDTSGYIDSENKWEYMGQLHLRLGDEDPVFNMGIVQAGLGYHPSTTLSLWAGYDILPIRNVSTKEFFYERRGWQQVEWKISTRGSFPVTYRSRLEERVNSSASGTSVRLRQKLGIKMLDINIGPSMTPIIWDELFFFLNHPVWVGDRSADQNRLFIGFDFKLAEHRFITVGYMNQFEWRNDINRMNHILSLSYRF